jgi:SAM-dependent methyltransferase
MLGLLRCLECKGGLRLAQLADVPGYPELGPDGLLACCVCGETYPLIAGTPRMLRGALRRRLRSDYPLAQGVFRREDDGAAPLTGELRVKRRTADSFAYEWQRFGGLRAEWRKNFLDYMRPHTADSFADRLVLDVGTGSGRHAFHAAALGASVVAVDIGQSIDVARANLPPAAMTVQADAEDLPFEDGGFDFVMSIGVLHHLPHPERALLALVQYVRPGGHLHVYLYWNPPRRWHSTIVRGVTVARHVTPRLPPVLLHALCYPLAAVLWSLVVLPNRYLRNRPRGRRLADALPLKTYADYPFGVLVNDQFDRFSAPLERRYDEHEVAELLGRAGLEQAVVLPNHGWIGDGRRPLRG